MLSLIVPADDAIWDAGSSVVTAAGVAGKQPHTAEEWAVAGQHAAKLLDGAKLLSEGGRLVAIKDSKSESPDFKGSPEEIQQLIDQKPELFFNYAQQFQLAAEETLAAIDAKNSTALLEAGSRVDEACEQCHKIFWYPSQFKPKP